MSRFLSLPFVLVLVNGALATSLTAAPKIGVLLKAKAPFWNAAERGALAAGEKLGAEVIVKAPPTENDVALQIQLLEILAQQKPAAIVVAANNPEALVEPVARVAAGGVKVVLIDTLLPGASKYVYVGPNQHDAGRAAGELLSTLIQDGDPVCFVKYSQNSGAATERERGAFERLKELRPHFVLRGSIYMNDGKDGDPCARLLDQFSDVKGILASATLATMPMIKALQVKGRAGAVQLVGFGFDLNAEVAAAIDNGALSGWVALLPGDMGFRSVQAAIALTKGEPVPPVIPTDFVVITRTNLHDPKMDALMEK